MEKILNLDDIRGANLNWKELGYLELEILICTDAIKSLIANQESSLLTTKKKFNDIITSDKEINSHSMMANNAYYANCYESQELAIKELQRQQRYSVFLTLFSFFEGRLKILCELLESTYNFKIKINDLNSGNDLQKYWNYLEKVVEIETTRVTPFFTPINQQKIVRNIIAHQNGIISSDQNKRIVIVTGLQIITIGSDSQIEIADTSFLLTTIGKIEFFFKELLISIDSRYSELEKIVKAKERKRYSEQNPFSNSLDDFDNGLPF